MSLAPIQAELHCQMLRTDPGKDARLAATNPFMARFAKIGVGALKGMRGRGGGEEREGGREGRIV